MDLYKFGCFKCGGLFLESEAKDRNGGSGRDCPLCGKRLVLMSGLPADRWEHLLQIPSDVSQIESACPICAEAISVDKEFLREEIQCPHCNCEIIIFGPSHALRVPRKNESNARPLTLEGKLTPAHGTPMKALFTLLGALLICSPLLAVPPLVVGGSLSAIAYVMESSPYSRTFVGVRNGARTYEKKKRTINPIQRRQAAGDAFWLGMKIGAGFSILAGLIGAVKLAGEAFPNFDFLTVRVATGLATFTGVLYGWFIGKSNRFPNLPDWKTLGLAGFLLGLFVGVAIVLKFSTHDWWKPTSNKT